MTDLKKTNIKRSVIYTALFFNAWVLRAQQAYFQQRLDYKMQVTLHDSDHTLSAFEEINYVNNSSQKLDFIYFHVWPNAYKNNSTALAKQLLWQGKKEFFFSKLQERGYIDSLDFKVNGKSIKWEFDKENIDICKLILNEPLNPSDSISISTPFYLKIPDAKFSRLGHTFQAYYMTQWYPKPAVFDKNGWHQMPYLDQGEFYSEFGTFDVSITLPENYVLAATGDRINASEEEGFLDRKVGETQHKLKDSSLSTDNSFPPSSQRFKTVRFQQKWVHDFAWFADKRFHVLKDEIELPISKRMVSTWVFFTPANSKLWKSAINYVNASTMFYSHKNGEYPYKHVTAIDGSIMAGGGMEYPNITVIGEASSAIELDMVITHEVGHNWFYGILGSNERDHPFLDEGLNSLYEMRYMRSKYPKKYIADLIGKDSTFKFFGLNSMRLSKYHELSFFSAYRSAKDQAINLKSTDFTEANYGNVVYSKTALVLDYLMDAMGEESFDAAMREYYRRHRFTHPEPEDLFKVLSEFAGKDLSVFEKHMFNSTDRVDYKIKNVKHNEDGTFTLKLKNKTGSLVPVNVYGYKNNKPVGLVWYDGFEKNRTVTFPPADVDYFKLDGLDRMPDIHRKNNTIKVKGLFKHTRPLQLKFVTALEKPNKAVINYMPLIGANYYNGFMLGLAVHNYNIYQKKFEYLVAPMYATRTKTPVGFAEFNFNFYPKKTFRIITLGMKAKTFSYDYYNTEFINKQYGSSFNDLYLNYYRISPYIQMEFKKKKPSSLITQSIFYQNNNLFTDSLDQASYSAITTSGPRSKNLYSFINQFNYVYSNARAIDPFDVVFDLQHTATMAKVSGTLNYKITVSKRKTIDIRLFAGVFLAGSASERGYYAFRASGYNGWHDYAFGNYYMARNERTGFGFTQFSEQDGALKVWTPLGQSSEWLVSLNVKSPRIFKLPIKVFADAVACDKRFLLKDGFLWDAGLNLILWADVMEVYLPLLYNTDIKNTLELNDVDFFHSIRFTFNIHKLVPKKVLQNSLF